MSWDDLAPVLGQVAVVVIIVLLVLLIFRKQVKTKIEELSEAQVPLLGTYKFREQVKEASRSIARADVEASSDKSHVVHAANETSDAFVKELEYVELALRRRFASLRRRAQLEPAEAVVEARDEVWKQGKRAQEVRNPGLTVGPAYNLEAMAGALPGAGAVADLRQLEDLYSKARQDLRSVDSLNAAAYIDLAESVALKFLVVAGPGAASQEP